MSGGNHGHIASGCRVTRADDRGGVRRQLLVTVTSADANASALANASAVARASRNDIVCVDSNGSLHAGKPRLLAGGVDYRGWYDSHLDEHRFSGAHVDL